MRLAIVGLTITLSLMLTSCDAVTIPVILTPHSTPLTILPDAFIQWHAIEDGQCDTAFIGNEMIHYGRCGEALLVAEMPVYQGISHNTEIGGQSQPAYLRQKYFPFVAETLRGTVVFTGTGTLIASEAEQRAIAEWAAMRYREAEFRYLSTPYGVQLMWQEESPTFCGGLWIYQTGMAFAWDCTGNEVLAADFLSAHQLEQFYTWLDSDMQWHTDQFADEQNGNQEIHLHLPAFEDIDPEVTTPATDEHLTFVREIYADLTGEVVMGMISPSYQDEWLCFVADVPPGWTAEGVPGGYANFTPAQDPHARVNVANVALGITPTLPKALANLRQGAWGQAIASVEETSFNESPALLVTFEPGIEATFLLIVIGPDCRDGPHALFISAREMESDQFRSFLENFRFLGSTQSTS